METSIDIETKFNVGDKVYAIVGDEISQRQIEEVSISVKITNNGVIVEQPTYHFVQPDYTHYIGSCGSEQLYATPEDAAEAIKQDVLRRFHTDTTK